jgi:hypothetical protein
VLRFRNSIEQLERIGESHADRVIADSGDETIIVAPATAKALTFKSEGHAGNTYKDWSEALRLERVRRGRRLEDSVRAAMKLGAIANPPGNDRARRGGSFDLRIEDRAAGAQRVG